MSQVQCGKERAGSCCAKLGTAWKTSYVIFIWKKILKKKELSILNSRQVIMTYSEGDVIIASVFGVCILFGLIMRWCCPLVVRWRQNRATRPNYDYAKLWLFLLNKPEFHHLTHFCHLTFEILKAPWNQTHNLDFRLGRRPFIEIDLSFWQKFKPILKTRSHWCLVIQ